ncbi:MAG: hypothetical protein OEM83_07870 [Gammaproteobacteria bacterium]|nr:hypothetical protein [Gammaproteobacteria bacterium]MDH5512425.1 hypothetical protein [Gammaproteobacteria bacterium]
MKLDKKSLIQIVILVVLIIGGAAAYFMQQDGGLDFISQLFESEPATIRAPATRAKAPAVERKSAPPAPAAATKSAAPEIPAVPAKGQIHGMPFVVENSYFESGVLGLRLGKDVTADLEVKVMLPGTVWETPAGKKIKVTDAGGPSVPLVALSWKEAGQKTPSEQKFNDKYTMVLEFGAEKDKKLPGKIHLVLPDETKSHVAGTFTADIRGFRIVEGKPDLSADSVETLQFLALRELLKDDPNKSLEVLNFRDGRYAPSDSAGKNMTGFIEAEYRIGEGPASVQRFQFEKAAGAWKLLRALGGNQLDEAHPVQVPGASDSPARMLTYLAAKKLESDIQKKYPDKNIYEPEFVSRHSDKFKIGVCEASYKIESGGKMIKTAYLFRQQTGGWALERALGDKEKVDFDTGKIVKR